MPMISEIMDESGKGSEETSLQISSTSTEVISGRAMHVRKVSMWKELQQVQSLIQFWVIQSHACSFQIKHKGIHTHRVSKKQRKTRVANGKTIFSGFK